MPEQDATETARKGGLKARFLRASAWAGGHAVFIQVLRLGSNLVVAKLLFPEAFAVMAIVVGVRQLLETFSDVGIKTSIIRSKHGDDIRYIDTAWTFQVIRGLALWLIACALAWPLALWYRGGAYPELMGLLPVAALSAIFTGFNSMSLATLNRHLMLGRMMMLQAGTRVLGIATMIILAWLTRSVWAMVAGQLVTAALLCVGSYLLLPGQRHRFTWDRESAGDLFHFGKWIFVATAMAFLLGRGDVLIIGAFLDPAVLGVFAIALVFPRAAQKILRGMLMKVVMPLYSRLAERGHEELFKRAKQLRVGLIVPGLAPMCLLIVAGDLMIDVFYDDRYAEAAWMVRLLGIAPALSFALCGQGMSILLTHGDSRRYTFAVAWSLTAKLAAMAVGVLTAGFEGVVVAIAISPLLAYPVTAWAIHKHRMWMPSVDAMSVGFATTLVAVGLLIRHLFGF